MAGVSRLHTAGRAIVASLDALGQRVFTFSQLTEILRKFRGGWGLPRSTTAGRFIEFLEEEIGLLKVVSASPENPDYRSLTRYIWRGASDLELALTIRGGAYFSHGTALHLHELTDGTPSILYVNKEQSAKFADSSLSQEGIDRAFSRPQRSSNFVFHLQEAKAVVLSGKNTGDAGVEIVTEPDGKKFRATGINRTLIDIVVRPAYSGGLANVVTAYRRAKGMASGKKICALLQKIDHVYPYEQAIGFLMHHTGYPKAEYQPLLSLRSDFDFYLDHEMPAKTYNATWKLYIPASMPTG